jgi:quercetin dioxygenase-like cupin family protein
MINEARQQSRRAFMRSGAIVASATVLTATASTEAIAAPDPALTAGIRAYRLFTGDEGDSHVRRGMVSQDVLIKAETIEFKETPAHGSNDWHNDPTPQFVITLTGVLEFTTRSGEAFTVHPGEVLVVEENVGTGHKWRLVDNAPWKRTYIIFKSGEDPHFVPDQASS